MSKVPSEMTDPAAGVAASTTRPGKRQRLVDAACDLVHRQGIARTTLADIAQAADVPVGNVYYYFKTKDDIIAAVVRARADQIESSLATLERRHRSPKARLKGLVRLLAGQAESIARYGCPHGTLCLELAKQSEGSEPHGAPLMQIPLAWAEHQFRTMGRSDAHDLAAELVVSYQGNAVLTSALRRPELMARQARRLEKWIDVLRA
jgi:AcrR family transcriptional regulator